MNHFLFRSTIGSQYKKGPANTNHSCPTRLVWRQWASALWAVWVDTSHWGFNRFYGYPKTSKEQQVKTHFCSPKFVHTKPIKQTIFPFFWVRDSEPVIQTKISSISTSPIWAQTSGPVGPKQNRIYHPGWTYV